MKNKKNRILIITICILVVILVSIVLLIKFKSPSEVISVDRQSIDVNEEEIYAAFQNADKFHLEWIHHKYYIDYDTVDINAYSPGVVVHETIKTAAALETEMKKYFNDTTVAAFMHSLNPKEEDGKLYINSLYTMDEYGEIQNHSFEILTERKCILNISVKYSVRDECNNYKILCEFWEGRWLFSNYVEDNVKDIKNHGYDYVDYVNHYYFNDYTLYPTEEDAIEIAKGFWGWEEYKENGELVDNKSTTVLLGEERHSNYYTLYLKWWVDDHWSTIDYLYIDKITGECRQTLE